VDDANRLDATEVTAGSPCTDLGHDMLLASDGVCDITDLGESESTSWPLGVISHTTSNW
jgi:hypothetical protein